MEKILLFTTVLLLFLSCKENDSIDSQYGAYIDTKLILKIQDNNGNNLLADTTNGYYDIDDIKTYISENNKKVEYLGEDLYKRKKVGYYNYPDMLQISLARPEYSSDIKKVIYYDTYIQFGSQPKDKITGYFTIESGFCRLDSAFYNDSLIYNEDSFSETSLYPSICIKPNCQ